MLVLSPDYFSLGKERRLTKKLFFTTATTLAVKGYRMSTCYGSVTYASKYLVFLISFILTKKTPIKLLKYLLFIEEKTEVEKN